VECVELRGILFNNPFIVLFLHTMPMLKALTVTAAADNGFPPQFLQELLIVSPTLQKFDLSFFPRRGPWEVMYQGNVENFRADVAAAGGEQRNHGLSPDGMLELILQAWKTSASGALDFMTRLFDSGEWRCLKAVSLSVCSGSEFEDYEVRDFFLKIYIGCVSNLSFRKI
jgi:hypothetical protein